MALDYTELDGYLKEKMDQWKVPGMAVGIVENGEVTYIGELGLRDIKNNLPVTRYTMFPVGSATKSFTAAAAAILVDEGKLDWDTPVKNYLPDFEMFDKFATERMTVRDMLCHRTGLPRHEFMHLNSSFTREEIVGRLLYLETNKDFRTAWQYSNHMYACAGYLLGVIAGTSWEDCIKTRIFEPLGLENCNFSVEEMKRYQDFSLPYAMMGPEAGQINYGKIDAMGPAGAINANLMDMLEWIKLQLGQGRAGEKQIISAGNVAQMHTQHMFGRVMPWSFPEVQASAYGMGWFIDIYRGRKLVQHGGNIDGFSSLIGFLPDEKLGIVILSNLNSNFLNEGLLYAVADRFLGYEDCDWSDRLKAEVDKFMLAMMEQMKAAGPDGNAGKAPSLSADEMQKYAGDYENPGYGRISIAVTDDALHMLFNNFDFTLTPTEKNEFSFVYATYGQAFKARFDFNGCDVARMISIPFEATVKDIVFGRC